MLSAAGLAPSLKFISQRSAPQHTSSAAPVRECLCNQPPHPHPPPGCDTHPAFSCRLGPLAFMFTSVSPELQIGGKNTYLSLILACVKAWLSPTLGTVRCHEGWVESSGRSTRQRCHDVRRLPGRGSHYYQELRQFGMPRSIARSPKIAGLPLTFE